MRLNSEFFRSLFSRGRRCGGISHAACALLFRFAKLNLLTLGRYLHLTEVMAKRVSLIVLGWMLLLLGAAGLVLPVLPGILFLLLGLSILSVEYEWARRWTS